MAAAPPLPRAKVGLAIAVLVALLFSKNVYSASLGSYYTFYLIDRFGLSVQVAQFFLFAYLAAIVVGTLIGGALADRIGRKDPLAVQVSKRVFAMPREAHPHVDNLAQAILFESEAKFDRMQAFLDKKAKRAEQPTNNGTKES